MIMIVDLLKMNSTIRNFSKKIQKIFRISSYKNTSRQEPLTITSAMVVLSNILEDSQLTSE